MQYVVFDLEFNQDFSSLNDLDKKKSQYPFEIIQIGAIKLDLQFQTINTFKYYVKPTFYTKISPFITDLTGITTEQLQIEQPFPQVLKLYIDFIEDPDTIFCTWGMSDIKELYKNAQGHRLNLKLLPRRFINLQPYVSKHLELPQHNLLSLKHAAQALNIPITHPFHDALYDAYYTSEIFKKIYDASMQPKIYDPTTLIIQPRQQKRVIDADQLIHQFEKIYARKMTNEEEMIIILAYKMGRTHQFLK